MRPRPWSLLARPCRRGTSPLPAFQLTTNPRLCSPSDILQHRCVNAPAAVAPAYPHPPAARAAFSRLLRLPSVALLAAPCARRCCCCVVVPSADYLTALRPVSPNHEQQHDSQCTAKRDPTAPRTRLWTLDPDVSYTAAHVLCPEHSTTSRPAGSAGKKETTPPPTEQRPRRSALDEYARQP